MEQLEQEHTLFPLKGSLSNFVADNGTGKGQLSSIVEALCRDIRTHDDEELAKITPIDVIKASAASMATNQTTTSPPTHQGTKFTSPSSLTLTRDLLPKSSWHNARSLQADCLHRMAQHQPSKREERAEG